VVVAGRGASVVEVVDEVDAVVVVAGWVVVVVGRMVGGVVVCAATVSTSAVVSVTVELVVGTAVRPGPPEHAEKATSTTTGRRSRRRAIAP
jgi:hypothetical protein